MRRPRILIVESNEILRILLFTTLRHQPVDVDTASSGRDAVERLARCDYAVAIIDLDMPADEVESFLAAVPRNADGPLVIGVRDPSNDTAGDPAVLSAVLSKPLELDTIAELVRECAQAVPEPSGDGTCPPAESEIRARLDRGMSVAN